MMAEDATTTSGTHSAFFYGTLMAPQVLHRVCHGSSHPAPWQAALLTITPALLPSYRRHRVKHADYPAILPCSSSSSADTSACVRGTYVTGLTEGDLWRLDIFEGDEYERRKVRVRLLLDGDGDGVAKKEEEEEEREAETYVWIAGEDRLEGEEWDFDEFVRERMRRWVGSEGSVEYAG